MRKRKIIEDLDASLRSGPMQTKEEAVLAPIKFQNSLILEVLLDCREAFTEQKKRTKTISAEVPFTAREEEVLNGLDKLDV